MDITSKAHKIVFCTTFSALGLKAEVIEGSGIKIVHEGSKAKFVNHLEQISFSSKIALQNKQKVIYVTERCVFELTEEGIMVTEIADGFDIDQDIISKMEFKPQISKCIKKINTKIYKKGIFGMREIISKD